MKLWFDLQWIRNIGQKYPALARFAEMIVYDVAIAVGLQVLLVLAVLVAALETKDPINLKEILLHFDWRIIVVVALKDIQAMIGKAVRENRRTDEGTSTTPPPKDDAAGL